MKKMNQKTLNLSIAQMRLHIFEKVEEKVNENNIADAHALSCEWIVPDSEGNLVNPDNDESYNWLYEVRHKKVTDKKYKKFTDLDF